MRRQSETPGAGNAGGGHGRADINNQHPHYTPPGPQVQECNAPSGDMPAYLRDGLIYVAGRHLCSIKGGTLHRTFSSKSELLRGALLFRLDVLGVAVEAGARVIVATDRESGKVWRVDLVDFMQRGWSYSHPRFGEQIGLALTEWQQPGADRRDEPEQLSLFGGGR